MKCSYQFGSKLDQSKLVNWMRSVPVKGVCAFPVRSTPDHKSDRGYER